MDVQLFETADAFELPEWRSLAHSYPHRSIFSTPEWNRVWWEEFGQDKKLFVLRFSRGLEPVGIVPLMLDRVDRAVRIRFVGGDDLTDYLGPIVAEEKHLPEIADALVRFLLEEIGGWSFFDAKCMPLPFGFAEWLVEAADRVGLGWSVDQNEVTSVLMLPPTFDDYLEGLPGKKRHELRRKMRRLEAEASEVALVSASDDLDDDLELFITMHKGSAGEKHAFMSPSRESFFRRVISTFVPQSVVSLDFLEVDGRRIAATLSFLYERVLYLYNSAYLTESGNLSPGLNLAARLIRRSIEQGLVKMDFLRGPERYKFDLGAEALPLHAVKLTVPKSRRD